MDLVFNVGQSAFHTVEAVFDTVQTVLDTVQTTLDTFETPVHESELSVDTRSENIHRAVEVNDGVKNFGDGDIVTHVR